MKLKEFDPDEVSITKGRVVLWSVIVIVIIIALTFLADAVGILRINVFGVRAENARRQVYMQTQSYNDGMAQQLQRYQLQYQTEKDPAARAAIRSTILHMTAGWDASKLDAGTQSFLEGLRR